MAETLCKDAIAPEREPPIVEPIAFRPCSHQDGSRHAVGAGLIPGRFHALVSQSRLRLCNLQTKGFASLTPEQDHDQPCRVNSILSLSGTRATQKPGQPKGASFVALASTLLIAQKFREVVAELYFDKS
jgi:hypothetical protein